MKNVTSSASESEAEALFNNYKAGEPIRVTLEEMVHPQQSMPMHTYNSTTDGITNENIQ